MFKMKCHTAYVFIMRLFTTDLHPKSALSGNVRELSTIFLGSLEKKIEGVRVGMEFLSSFLLSVRLGARVVSYTLYR